jgi:hypothetical protein
MPAPNIRTRRLAVLALLVFLGLLSAADVVIAQHGCDAGNLIGTCDFEQFTGSPPRQVPVGWNAFVLSGSVNFMGVSGPESHSVFGSSSLRLDSGDAFVAGIYTQVAGLQPGKAYKASIGWGAPTAPTDSFGRQLGIDPTGGTDPNAATVVWGPVHWGDGRMLNYPPPSVNIDISAVAQSPVVTVFFKVDHNRPTAGALVFIDAVSLIVDPNQPAQPPPTAVPTATAVPVAVVQVQPSPTRRPTASPTATATSTARPTLTPTATATATNTPMPTATSTNTPTPTQTYTPEPTATATLPLRPTATPGAPVPARPAASGGGQGGVGTLKGLLWGGLGALGGAGLLGTALTIARKR